MWRPFILLFAFLFCFLDQICILLTKKNESKNKRGNYNFAKVKQLINQHIQFMHLIINETRAQCSILHVRMLMTKNNNNNNNSNNSSDYNKNNNYKQTNLTITTTKTTTLITSSKRKKYKKSKKHTSSILVILINKFI